MSIINSIFYLSILLGLFTMGVKAMRLQFCHSHAQHMITQNILSDHVDQLSKPSYYLFMARQQCQGLYKKIKKDHYQYHRIFKQKTQLQMELYENL